jgi:S-adenosylmethionine:tRNA ribosyltransferase-isomerase
MKEGKKIIVVGTSTVRTLETVVDADGFVKAGSGWTDKFIYPPYEFKIADHLITNFHRPYSTLLMLVSAFAGRDFIFRAYRKAIKENYRFYSFGDAMLIL